MLKCSISQHFPSTARLIAASVVLTAFLISCGGDPREPDPIPESTAPVEKDTVSEVETDLSGAEPVPFASEAIEATAATEVNEAAIRECIVYSPEDRRDERDYQSISYIYEDGDLKTATYEHAPGSAVHVVVPDGVTEIAPGAFAFCQALKRVECPKGVRTIGDEAFNCCDKLESLVLPEGVTKIGRDAFKDCAKLKSIVLPDGVTELGQGAFKG